MSTRAVPFYCPYCGEEDLDRRARPTVNGIAAVAPGVSSYALPE